MHNKLKQCLEDIADRENEYEKILYVDAKGRDLNATEYKRMEQLEKELEALDIELKPLQAQEQASRNIAIRKANGDKGYNNKTSMNELEEDSKIIDFQIIKKAPFEKRSPIANYVRAIKPVTDDEDVDVWKVVCGLLGKTYDNDRKVTDMVAKIRAASGTSNLLNDYLSGQILDAALPKSRLIQAGMRTIPLLQGVHRFGKVTAIPSLEWKNELDSTTERSATIDDVTFTARTLRGWIQLSKEFLQDGMNAEQVVRGALTAAVAQGIDDAGLSGSGVPPIPQGIITTPGVSTFAVGSLTSYDDFIVAQRLIWEQDGNDATAVILSPNAKAQLMALKGAGEGQPIPPPFDMRDLRFLQTSKLTSGSGTTAVMGDFSSLVLGIRLGATIYVSPVISETYGVKFLVAFRGDIVCVKPEDFAVLTGISNNDLT